MGSVAMRSSTDLLDRHGSVDKRQPRESTHGALQSGDTASAHGGELSCLGGAARSPGHDRIVVGGRPRARRGPAVRAPRRDHLAEHAWPVDSTCAFGRACENDDDPPPHAFFAGEAELDADSEP